ncbi:MAG: cytochrome c [Acidobacteriia bacterium]|nr:cytochrome c [Terriglobia bacterium]
MKKLLLKVSLLVLVAGLMLPAFATAADTGPDLFASKCAACHGKDGAGSTPMGKSLKLKDLGSADVQKASDKDLKDLIEKGKPPKMPAYAGKLSPAQVDELVKFIRSLKK